MKTQKPTLALLAATLLLPALLHADSLTVNGDLPSAFTFRPDGTLVSKGVFGTGALQPGEQGAGTRMLWYPGKAAFRVGQVSGTEWNEANIGQFSVAMGKDASADGTGSIAMGEGATTWGSDAVAIGRYAWAYYGSIVIGGGGTLDAGAIAIGNSFAYMGNSIVIGNGNYSSYDATAIGSSNTVNGYRATAIGYSNRADAHSSFVVGCYNVGGGSDWDWIPADPLFEIGNGTASNARSSAFIVYKDGSIKIPKPQGDIPMGEFQ